MEIGTPAPSVAVVTEVNFTSASVSRDVLTVNAASSSGRRQRKSQIEEDGQGVTIDNPSNGIQATVQQVKRGDAWGINKYEWAFGPGISPQPAPVRIGSVTERVTAAEGGPPGGALSDLQCAGAPARPRQDLAVQAPATPPPVV